jgi:hypothetical protein
MRQKIKIKRKAHNAFIKNKTIKTTTAMHGGE